MRIPVVVKITSGKVEACCPYFPEFKSVASTEREASEKLLEAIKKMASKEGLQNGELTLKLTEAVLVPRGPGSY